MSILKKNLMLLLFLCSIKSSTQLYATPLSVFNILKSSTVNTLWPAFKTASKEIATTLGLLLLVYLEYKRYSRSLKNHPNV